MNKHHRQILLSFCLIHDFPKITNNREKKREKQLIATSLKLNCQYFFKSKQVNLKHIGGTAESSTIACFVSTMLRWPALSQAETSEPLQSTDWLIGKEGIRECIKVQAPLYVHLI